MTAALQRQMRDALLVDAEVFDTAGVRPEVGTNAVQRGLDAGVDVVRVQVVQHQEAADDLVVGEGPNQRRVALLRDLDDPGEARRIQAHDGAHQPFGALQRHLVAGLGELVEDLLDLLRLVLELSSVHGGGPVSRAGPPCPASAAAGPRRLGRCTCGRRTAGTGRSCGRRA